MADFDTTDSTARRGWVFYLIVAGFIVVGLFFFIGGWIVPATVKSIDPLLLKKAAQNSPTIVDAGLKMVGADRVGPAQIVLAAAATGKPVNVKKGQFMAPGDMRHVVDKILSVGNREITRNLGFNLVWRWQDGFNWQSPLANGFVPAYQAIDAQVTYRVPSAGASLKLGGSNIFNNRYLFFYICHTFVAYFF